MKTLEKLEACPKCGEVKRWLYDAQVCAACGEGDRWAAKRNAEAALREAQQAFRTVANTEWWLDECLEGTARAPTALREFARSCAEDIARALAGKGCHICGSDCAGANPPVMYCPMKDRP
jgi:hypothetical protein